MDTDGSSSIYSNASSRNPMSRVTRVGTYTTSRPNSYTPSYMSNIQARPPDSPSDSSLPDSASYRYHERFPSHVALKPIPRRPVGSALKPTSVPQDTRVSPGLLLVVFASAPHPSTIFFLETLLARRSFSAIAVVASKGQEASIKQLRIDIYALIGKLRKELGVYTFLQDTWIRSDMTAVVQEAVKGSNATDIHGIICTPEFDESGTVGGNILNLGEETLQHSWKQSVGFVHAASKATIALLQARASALTASTSRTPSVTGHNPFFLVAGLTTFTAAAEINRSACDSLVRLLETAIQPTGVTVGYAETLLIPDRTQSRESDATQLIAKDENLQLDYSVHPIDDADSPLSESPTKLWNMWAIQNDS